MRIVGIDPSLTATGIAATTTNDPAVTFTETITSPRRGHERLSRILEEINTWTRIAQLVVIEGPAYGSAAGARQQGHHERAGLWWLITHDLWRKHIQVAVVDPVSRIRYATGKGRAGKDEVLAAVIRRYTQIEVANNNEADALVLAAMGAHHAGFPLIEVPATHRIALAKVAWPDIPELEPKEAVS